MKSAAVICADGIGDGLLMMIVANNLKREGYRVTIFHNRVKELSSLFEDYYFAPHPPLMSLEEELQNFSHVIVENDNSEQAWLLFALRAQGKLANLLFFFPTPCEKMQREDFLFDEKCSVAENLVQGCYDALHLRHITKENGFTLPKNCQHRRFSKRIIIHPTSNDPKRNWSPSQYLLIATKLREIGFSISFLTSSKERNEWLHVCDAGFQLPKFPTFKEVAAYIGESGFLIGNDSGLGHLASNLHIPTLTISGNPKRVRLWRPDWGPGRVVTLPFPLPNFKGIHFRFRENHWQHFVPVKRVLKEFYQLQKETVSTQDSL